MGKSIKFEVTLKNGRDYYVEAEANLYFDNYGADADGNRGISQTVIEVDNFIATDEEGNEVNDPMIIKELEKYAFEKATEDDGDPEDYWDHEEKDDDDEGEYKYN